MHISVPVANSMEYINATSVSPLVDKVQIKVCYVGQDPNRNGSVITKEVAMKMGQNLPGCPIVGYYNEDTKDFEGHNRDVIVRDGKYRVVDLTKPYGFVDTNAKVWFQKFSDEGVEHEYLCTEGYIWTKIYEESQRIITEGNNQSMELAENLDGFWTKDVNSNRDIFIINDGLIEKLCILGTDVEPCFEGSQIASSFSMTKLFSMIQEIKDSLVSKEGNMEQEKTYTLEEIPEYVALQNEYAILQTENDTLKQTNESLAADIENYQATIQTLENEKASLFSQNETLTATNVELTSQNETLTSENEALTKFKLQIEHKQKEDKIAEFYMLTDEDKKDVIDNIDTYSLEDIENKLAVICFRNKVSFNKEDEGDPDLTFNMHEIINSENDNTPSWVQAVLENEE